MKKYIRQITEFLFLITAYEVVYRSHLHLLLNKLMWISLLKSTILPAGHGWRFIQIKEHTVYKLDNLQVIAKRSDMYQMFTWVIYVLLTKYLKCVTMTQTRGKAQQ